MTVAAGYFDAQNIWRPGEDDRYPTFSERMDAIAKSVSDRLAAEAILRKVHLIVPGPGAQAAGALANNTTTNLLTGTKLGPERRNGFEAINRTAGTITVPLTGDYVVRQGLALDSATSFQFTLTKNGTRINEDGEFNTPSPGAQRYAGGARTLRLAQGDVLRLLAYQASGAARSIPATKPDATATFFELELVRFP